MEINKRCISAFAEKEPFVALATKSKLFDPSFSLTSELILINYISGKIYPALSTDMKFCKIRWCEFDNLSYLVAGHENGIISIYNKTDDGLVLIKSKQCMEDDVTALDFLPTKGVLVAGSSKGKIIFWTLSNFDKEYALDIPISGNISSIAWNPKVSKILCVGTTDGNIKVLDIKKNSIIMTLNSKDFTEVKHLEWDLENNTKLNVMSEKGYLTVFDLSNDSVSKFGNHSEQLIGFSKNVLVSKTKIEVNGTFVAIKDSFDCAISKKDPVIALSYASGSTNIISIPVVKNHVPFCRFSRFVVTSNGIFEIKVNNDRVISENDPFYGSLIKMVHTSNNIDEIAQFLLSNSSSIPSEHLNPNSTVEVMIDNPIDMDFVKGNIEKLVECDVSMDLSLMNCLFTKDLTVLNDVNNFKILYIFSRLLNDFSYLSKISNPRILAAFLLYHKDKTSFDILSESKEGLIIKSIITKDLGQYIDYRIPSNMPYLSRMKFLESLVDDIQPYIKGPFKSKKLSEYFWYKVFMDNGDKVKDLEIVDSDIQYYLKAHKQQDFSQRIQPTSNNVGQRNVSEISERVKSMDIKSSELPSQSIPSKPVSSFQHIPVSQSSSQIPTMPNRTMQQFPTSGIPKPPSPRQQSHIQFPSAPSNVNNTSSTVYGNPPLSVPQFPSAPSSNIYGNLSSSVSQPQISHVPTSGYSIPHSSEIPKPSMPAPIHNTFPKSPYSGAIPQRPTGFFSQQNSSVGSNFPQRQPSIPQIQPVSAPRSNPLPSIQNISNTSSPEIENAPEIVSRFEELVIEVKQKASMNNSLILRQRKIQCLNALNTYDSIDKNNIPSSILHTMSLVTKRFFSAGENMKNDLSILVEGFNDVVWLKAVVELIKLVY